MLPTDTYRRRLRERALDKYGYVTTRDAVELGVPEVELRKLAYRGGLEHVGYGIYRFDDVPPTGRDGFMEAVLRAGPGAYLTEDAVLALHDLALVNPRRVRVGTPRRVRTAMPATVEVMRRRLAPADLTNYEGIPSTTVARALVDSRQRVMRDRLIEAAREAARRGLISQRDTDRVLAEIEHGPLTPARV